MAIFQSQSDVKYPDVMASASKVYARGRFGVTTPLELDILQREKEN